MSLFTMNSKKLKNSWFFPKKVKNVLKNQELYKNLNFPLQLHWFIGSLEKQINPFDCGHGRNLSIHLKKIHSLNADIRKLYHLPENYTITILNFLKLRKRKIYILHRILKFTLDLRIVEN